MIISIIGAGPGGYIAAFEAARKGATVNLIEADYLGGTCLNYGCIPTKTLKSSAEAMEISHKLTSFGLVGIGEVKADMSAINKRKHSISEVLRGGIEKTCAQLKINLIKGRGKIINAKHIAVTTNEGNILNIDTDKIIIATGSKNLELPSIKIDHKYILSSDDALELQHIPESMIIVGGGVVGCELASIFSAFGTKIYVVEGLDRLLPIPSIDEEISKLLQREMKKAGIKTELKQIVSTCKIENNKVHAELIASPFLETQLTNNKPISIEASVLVVTAGRVPNSEGLGLSELGITQDKRGWVLTNENYETNVKDIYAIGDILGPQKIMLAHMASAEAIKVIENIVENKSSSANYAFVPSAIFTSPEIACVGITEKQAIEKNLEVDCPIFQFRELGKAQAMNCLPGCFKMIIEKESGKILGCHIAGAHSTDLIAELTLAIQLGATAKDIADTIHAHPTLSEGFFELTHNYLYTKNK